LLISLKYVLVFTLGESREITCTIEIEFGGD